MAVYVDRPLWWHRGRLWAHLVADDLQELHNMAEAVGIPWEWFHNGSMPHYDVTSPKREQAMAKGASPIGRRAMVALKRCYRREKE